LTLCVFAAGTHAKLEAAIDALRSCEAVICCALSALSSAGPPGLSFGAIDCFDGGRVIFARPDEDQVREHAAMCAGASSSASRRRSRRCEPRGAASSRPSAPAELRLATPGSRKTPG